MVRGRGREHESRFTKHGSQVEVYMLNEALHITSWVVYVTTRGLRCPDPLLSLQICVNSHPQPFDLS